MDSVLVQHHMTVGDVASVQQVQEQLRISQRETLRGSESSAIVQRLEELMRTCREDGHQLTYRDLLHVRHGGGQPPSDEPVAYHPI